MSRHYPEHGVDDTLLQAKVYLQQAEVLLWEYSRRRPTDTTPDEFDRLFDNLWSAQYELEHVVPSTDADVSLESADTPTHD
ncbi:hypothetical protein E6P09_01140 [Haloferax mediterranei ATCC 33500]|uniref:Uncharacterized protein n=1 Tax=Haloferax mediterranei (strain ATCC 33500 / DSM 1411 / JCM 8866 / NBRC 14739 / NCIMB 2177 / R-4) TaxID=523841 RepID=I3R6E1_HALMT|nr:hypothetical protein [Haloferax mediterranei]AFK19801.1 hypothetical protein HFX_2110 [Haloferax mediterranei ATCC 33500]AHZ23186.1 hypothetical protein BM92_11305 [Haloferax mediterranei ATCC 33500]MDX5987452.1 hypothetical protein [Haloferax mediterranei ATCC 33500]QCQ73953.1 hypothetical protein E6P09_01140 [Haloferax mediterranei ATCC 33500]